METSGVTLRILPEYQLKLCFANGSEAIIDMKQRTQGIRFGRLADVELFAAGKLVGSEVVWEDGETSIHASINELLDSMQMD